MPKTRSTSRYVIIDGCDQPRPDMVCQLVPGVGYCYLNRTRGRDGHDGMSGVRATSLEAFGFTWAEAPDGTVTFTRTSRTSTATYRDGVPRPWQHPDDTFTHVRRTAGSRRSVPAAADVA